MLGHPRFVAPLAARRLAVEQTVERLSALDSFFLDIEREDAPMHIGALCLFDEPQPGVCARLTLQRLRAHVESRLSAIPRYRQRLARVPLEGHPVWVDSTDFRIADHVRAVALPCAGSPERLEETVSWIFSQPLSRSRPLWEIWLIEGLPGGGFALACKTHHCLCDGLGGAALLTAILGTEPFTKAERPSVWRPRRPPSGFELLRSAVDSRWHGVSTLTSRAASNWFETPGALVSGASEMLSMFRSLAEAAWSPPTTTAFDHPTGSGQRFLWWSVPLDDVKRVGRRLGGTVNEIALVLLSEAFAKTSAASLPGRSLRVYCPVGAMATAPSTATLGNCVSGMLVDLPVAALDLESRWHRVKAAARRSKDSGSVEGTFLLAGLADMLGSSVLSRFESVMTAAPVFNLVLTNVPGPTFPLYLFGQRMTSVSPLVPLFHGQGLGVAIFSYNGRLTWGFHVDASQLDQARKLRSALAAAVIQLARLADAAVTASGPERKKAMRPFVVGTPRREEPASMAASQ